MDILYVVGKRLSGWNDNELRYSLRSLTKNCAGIGRVFIVGHIPAFVDRNNPDVVCVEFRDPTQNNKHFNILAAIEHVVYHTDISEHFLLSSDDHYYVQPTDFEHYPVYWRGREIPANTDSKRWYDITLNSTREVLDAFGLPAFHYAWHGNTHFNKRLFMQRRFELLRKLTYLMPECCEPSCLMLNYWRAVEPDTMPEHEIIRDGKIGQADTFENIDAAKAAKHVLTTTDAVGLAMRDWLFREFPKKAKYER